MGWCASTHTYNVQVRMPLHLCKPIFPNIKTNARKRGGEYGERRIQIPRLIYLHKVKGIGDSSEENEEERRH